MKALLRFLKVTLIGGLLVVLPIWVSILLLLKAISGATKMLMPLAKLVPQTIVHDNIVALILLLLICFFVGLAMLTRPGRRTVHWMTENILSRIPGFALVRGVTRQFAGDKKEDLFQPALVEIEDALVPAFIIEKHTDGHFTVFVSSSPTPMAGAIYILAPERVHPLDVPLRKAMTCITKWGTGAAEMRDAMLASSSKPAAK